MKLFLRIDIFTGYFQCLITIVQLDLLNVHVYIVHDINNEVRTKSNKRTRKRAQKQQ